jgi:tetratricopeptide (TPR) repeat protein
LTRPDAGAAGIEAAEALGGPESCGDVDRLMSAVEPPAGAEAQAAIAEAEAALARARVETQLDHLPEALEAITVAHAAATRAGHPPLTARVETVYGAILTAADDPGAVEHQFASLSAAIAGRDDEAFAAAAIGMIRASARNGGDLESARRWSALAGAAIERLGGDAELDAMRLRELGLVLGAGGSFAEASEVLERSMAATELALGADSATYASQLFTIADVFNRNEQFRTARPFAARALEIREKVLGPDHIHTVESRSQLAQVEWPAGDRAAARARLEQVIAACERVAGPDSECVRDALITLAQVLHDDGDAVRSFETLDRAEAIAARLGGEDTIVMGTTVAARGLLLVEARRYDEARAQIERAIAIFDRAAGPGSLYGAYPRFHLARAYAESGDCASAAPILRELEVIADQILRRGDPLWLYPKNLIAECALATGQYADAVTRFEEVLAFRETIECWPGEKGRTQWGLAQALAASGGDAARARALAEAALEDFRVAGDRLRAERATAWLAAH